MNAQDIDQAKKSDEQFENAKSTLNRLSTHRKEKHTSFRKCIFGSEGS
jgi:hypothetical protein